MAEIYYFPVKSLYIHLLHKYVNILDSNWIPDYRNSYSPNTPVTQCPLDLNHQYYLETHS